MELNNQQLSLIQLATSGSFQSHLSASNSLQRLRAAHPHDLSLKTSPVTSTLDTRGLSHPDRISSVLSLLTLPVESQFLWIRSWPTLGLRWRILLVYCCISVLVLSSTIFNTIRTLDRSSRTVQKTQGMVFVDLSDLTRHFPLQFPFKRHH
jgi:hypothetical protein